jgi:small subunit ribosomal protein S7
MKKSLIKVLINTLLKKGNKFNVEKICIAFLKRLKYGYAQNPVLTLSTVVYRIKPVVTLKSKKVAGTNIKIPSLIKSGKDISVAVKWLIDGAIQKSGDQKISDKLIQEVQDILVAKGSTIKKKNELHKMALSNRPFLKYLK